MEEKDFKLHVYPNPMNNFIILSYNLLRNSNVKISLFDITGKQFNILNEERLRPKGVNTERLSINNSIPSGVYI